MSVVMIKRQFDKIIGHVKGAFPTEAGGYLGGLENIILGIFPVVNYAPINYSDKEISKEIFESTMADRRKASEFFENYGMEVVGFYHSHPLRNMPIPSHEDIKAHRMLRERIMVVVSLAASDSAKISAFSTLPQLKREKLIVVKNNSIQKYLNRYLVKHDIEHSAEDYIASIEKLEKRVASILLQKKKR